MKTITSTTLSLILATTAFAEHPQVQITARYEGFDLSRYAEIANFNKDLNKDINKRFSSSPQPRQPKDRNLLSAPAVTTKSGQQAVIEIIRENQVPHSPAGEKTANSGVTLDVLPVVEDGRITLSGKSTLRRRLTQDGLQPLGAVSFAAHETFFSGAVQNGKELTIAVGDGPKDKARIILTVQLINYAGAPIK